MSSTSLGSRIHGLEDHHVWLNMITKKNYREMKKSWVESDGKNICFMSYCRPDLIPMAAKAKTYIQCNVFLHVWDHLSKTLYSQGWIHIRSYIFLGRPSCFCKWNGCSVVYEGFKTFLGIMRIYIQFLADTLGINVA